MKRLKNKKFTPCRIIKQIFFIFLLFLFNCVGFVYFNFRGDCFDEDTRLRKCTEEFKRRLEELNGEIYHQVQGHLVAAVDNCIAGIRYFRVQDDGPRIPIVSDKEPLVPR